MTVLGDLSDLEIDRALIQGDLTIGVGPYLYRIQTPVDVVKQGVKTLYSDYPLIEAREFSDFHVSIRPMNWLHKLRSRVEFYIDNDRPFNRIEARHAFAFLEWGMNWCVAKNVNEYLKLHSAVVAKNGKAIILPGLPGAGKSTLCAALSLSGWRVLSDEYALIPLGSSNVVPICRPVSLKNESIDVIKSFSSDAVFGPLSEETHKGAVVHMKGDLMPDSHDINPVPARFMIFPEYEKGAELSLEPRAKAECFMFAALHAFNYSMLGVEGFNTMSTCMDAVDCFGLTYSSLDEAIEVFDQLALAEDVAL